MKRVEKTAASRKQQIQDKSSGPPYLFSV